MLYARFQDGWAAAEERVRAKCEMSPDAPLDVPQEKSVFVSACAHVAGPRFLYGAGFAKFLNSTMQFMFPVLLSAVLEFVDGQSPLGAGKDDYVGYVFAGCLGIAMGCKAILENVYFHSAVRAGWQVRSAVTTAVYRKSLKLSAASRQAHSRPLT